MIITLLEMIVTVAILFTLLSILVPTMSGFAKSAGDQISDSNLELLNFATHSYASFHEIENKDIFERIICCILILLTPLRISVFSTPLDVFYL